MGYWIIPTVQVFDLEMHGVASLAITLGIPFVSHPSLSINVGYDY